VILVTTAFTTPGFPIHFRRSRRVGFSLIEVLLALAIFLMSVVAIAHLVDMGMDRELESQFNIRGARLAQSKMGEITSGVLGPLSSLSSNAGSFDNEPEWSWSMSASVQGNTPNLYLVTLTLTRDNRGQPFKFILNQMAIDPYTMGSAQPATSTTDVGSATSTIYGNGTTTTTAASTGGGGTP